MTMKAKMITCCLLMCFFLGGCVIGTEIGGRRDLFFYDDSKTSVRLSFGDINQGDVTKNISESFSQRDILSELLGRRSIAVSGQSRKAGNFKKSKLRLLKYFLISKLLLFTIVFPIIAATANFLSWKAVTLSLLAFATSKMIFLWNLFLEHRRPMSSSPIIIQSSQLRDPVGNRKVGQKISLRPEGHQRDEDNQVHRSDQRLKRNEQLTRIRQIEST